MGKVREARTTERKFREIIESVSDGLLAIDPKGRIVLVNAQSEKLFGYRRDELLGRPLETLLPERLRDQHLSRRASYSVQPVTRPMGSGLSLLARRKDGTEFPVDISLSPLRNDREPWVIASIRDISERKKVAENKKRHLERVRILYEINTAVTSTLDLQTIASLLLDKITVLLPYAAAMVHLVDDRTRELEPIASRNISTEEWKLRRPRGGGLVRLLFDNRTPLTVGNLEKDPRVRNREFFRQRGLTGFAGLPLIARGKALGVLSLFTREELDFTPNEVDFLAALAGELAVAIDNAQLYERARKQTAVLERANKVKDEFLSVVSHELRTPLNVVMGYAALVNEGVLGEVNPQQAMAMEKITRHCQNQLDMVNAMLQVATLEAAEVPVENAPLSLALFLDDLKSDYEVLFDRELTLVWDYPPDLPTIITDRIKLRQILQNLIDNAVKFTGRGRVSIAARDLTEAGKVEFKVGDTGAGIPRDQLSLIFDKFRQVDSSETRNYGGVGLGLYIVKRFTELLGGKVEAASVIGKGSTFTVTVPAVSTSLRAR